MLYKYTCALKSNNSIRAEGVVDGKGYTDAYVNATIKVGDNYMVIDVKQDWSTLYFGHVSPVEVQEAVRDEQWQQYRLLMKGMSLDDKYKSLHAYLDFAKDMLLEGHELRMVHVRITNYVTALSRGGLIKPEDYKQ